MLAQGRSRPTRRRVSGQRVNLKCDSNLGSGILRTLFKSLPGPTSDYAVIRPQSEASQMELPTSHNRSSGPRQAKAFLRIARQSSGSSVFTWRGTKSYSVAVPAWIQTSNCSAGKSRSAWRSKTPSVLSRLQERMRLSETVELVARLPATTPAIWRNEASG
jgi:hypothetical protein